MNLSQKRVCFVKADHVVMYALLKHEKIICVFCCQEELFTLGGSK